MINFVDRFLDVLKESSCHQMEDLHGVWRGQLPPQNEEKVPPLLLVPPYLFAPPNPINMTTMRRDLKKQISSPGYSLAPPPPGPN